MDAGDLTTLALLYLLATLDAAFIGYREAAGRNALIRKGAYYRRAILRGALWGQLAVLVACVALAVLYLTADDRAALAQALHEAARRMLTVYVPYAAIVVAAFVVRLLPSVDVRSLTSVLIFGPFLLVRPLVMVAGVAWGSWAAHRADVMLVGLLVLAEMLLLERFLLMLRARRAGGRRVMSVNGGRN